MYLYLYLYLYFYFYFYFFFYYYYYYYYDLRPTTTTTTTTAIIVIIIAISFTTHIHDIHDIYIHSQGQNQSKPAVQESPESAPATCACLGKLTTCAVWLNGENTGDRLD